MRQPDTESLKARAGAWIAQDVEESTRAELQRLVELGEWDILAHCLTPLAFGTAGLRAVEGPGPGRMNRSVVIRTTRGLADYLLATQPETDERPVVVGGDARTHSMVYQKDVVAVLVAAGLTVRFFEHPVPTPLVAYAARVLDARAAICITASHNPPEYAGFKLYADNAVQIVAPVDERISEAIARVGAANEVERADAAHIAQAAQPLGTAFEEGYLRAIGELRTAVPGDRDFPIVYTPLHGVGRDLARRALHQAGYQKVFVVSEQAEPDPAFPTVRFPNPEEPGALDLAMALADETEAELLLANDPDADRLAACVRDGSGPIRQLSGNQVGLLLADYLLRHYAGSAKPLVVSSIVSSPMIDDVAAHYGATCLRTLTGFKWMLNAALSAEREFGAQFVFGFEEALGYCVGGAVRDKDGISAAVAFADLVMECRSRGASVGDALGQLYERHGLWQSRLSNLELPVEALGQALERVKALVANPPERLAGLEVLEVVDFRRGTEQRPWYLGFAELVEFRLAGRARVLVRPSGTEPKIKIYADYRGSYDPNQPRRVQEATGEARASELCQALRQRLQVD